MCTVYSETHSPFPILLLLIFSITPAVSNADTCIKDVTLTHTFLQTCTMLHKLTEEHVPLVNLT